MISWIPIFIGMVKRSAGMTFPSQGKRDGRGIGLIIAFEIQKDQVFFLSYSTISVFLLSLPPLRKPPSLIDKRQGFSKIALFAVGVRFFSGSDPLPDRQ